MAAVSTEKAAAPMAAVVTVEGGNGDASTKESKESKESSRNDVLQAAIVDVATKKPAEAEIAANVARCPIINDLGKLLGLARNLMGRVRKVAGPSGKSLLNLTELLIDLRLIMFCICFGSIVSVVSRIFKQSSSSRGDGGDASGLSGGTAFGWVDL